MNSIVGTIREWIEDRNDQEYVFAAHLCNVHNIEPLSIGSVLFESRELWLKKQLVNKSISENSLITIQKSLQENSSNKFIPSENSILEKAIIDTIKMSDFVCTVSVSKKEAESGFKIALMAARVATTVISLYWTLPSSALKTITLPIDRQPYLKNYLVANQNRISKFSTSQSYPPGGNTWLNEEEWEKLRKNFHNVLNCGGNVISYVTHGKEVVDRPNILHTLFQSIVWFHEGCREQMDLIAIVKFCSSMDALACGGRVKGIQDLMRARLGCQDGSEDLKKIKDIYKDGRSRTVHGTSEKFSHDWSTERKYVEMLARVCLVECLRWANKNTGEDNPENFRI